MATDGLAFDLYDERWRDCWLAATSAVRSKKRQVDLDVVRRVAKLLEHHGPESDRPLTLRIYGTMIKGFCVINNERARVLFTECERVVLAFTRQPFADGAAEGKLRLPTAKRPRMEAALTLDLDLARVEASETFDWTQAPLEDGALLRLGGGEGFDLHTLGGFDLGGHRQLMAPQLGLDLIDNLPAGDAGWLPSGLDAAAPAPEALQSAAGAEGQARVQDVDATQLVVFDPHSVPREVLETHLAMEEVQARAPAVAVSVPEELRALMAARAGQRPTTTRGGYLVKPGVVYGFDAETTVSSADYEQWQQEVPSATRRRTRAAGYAELLATAEAPAERLAPRLRLLADPPHGALPLFAARDHLSPHLDAGLLARLQGTAAEAGPLPLSHAEATAPADVAMPPPGDGQALEPWAAPPADDLGGLAAVVTAYDGAAVAQGGGAEAQDEMTAEVGEIIRGSVRGSGRNEAAFHELVPPAAADRFTAARTFSALLALACAGELTVQQDEPFGPISISEPIFAH